MTVTNLSANGATNPIGSGLPTDKRFHSISGTDTRGQFRANIGVDMAEASEITPAASESAAHEQGRGANGADPVGGISTVAMAGRTTPITAAATRLGHTKGRGLEVTGDAVSRIEVLRPGMLTTVQDWPGRIGYWHIGVPPSGPMDDLSFRLGNRVLGNAEGAAGLECTLGGPALKFSAPTWVCVTGAPTDVTVNGTPVRQWRTVLVPAGGVLDIGAVRGPGMRCYVLLAGGLELPEYLGSTATFTLGKFGGSKGDAVRAGDTLELGPHVGRIAKAVPMEEQPVLSRRWELAVTEGPHGAPEFFTRKDFDTIVGTDYEVHFNSDRTGVRLIGPKPEWARTDGGEAGLHPSNIHDTPYSVGALDFTGDTPILLGPDGPSLGGFVCPVTVVAADRWKLGQLCPGDTVRFVPIRAEHAASIRELGPARRAAWPAVLSPGGDGDDGVLRRADVDDEIGVTYRRQGNDGVLVEYGTMTLDLGLRARVHALHQHLLALGLRGVAELTPGVRSLQIRVDPAILPVPALLDLLAEAEAHIPAADRLVVPSRTVHLPLSWDDPSTREAITRYMHGVRADAPWCPWNIEFIRRMNGSASVREVYDTVFGAEYLVLGLGDVYLGAPVATPTDPRHRLVTTKYNPARTWTPENAVGIGGAYLCIYGMEGPGGYQFVGRTTQVWNHHADRDESPWLLRYFDRIRWYPVEADELLDLRADFAAGKVEVRAEDGEFALAEYRKFLSDNAESIDEFRARQADAFAAERDSWRQAGELPA